MLNTLSHRKLVLALACFPQQVLGYDQVTLGLVARSAYQHLVLALLSWLAVGGALVMGEQQGLTLVLVYGPAAVIAIWPTLLQHGIRRHPLTLSKPLLARHILKNTTPAQNPALA